MISDSQFCTNALTEFTKPSGSLNLKSQLSTDVNRPLINGYITQNFSIEDIGKLEIEITGVNIKLGKNLFRQDCFDFNCFEEEGIETYIKNISDICLVENNKFLTSKQRQENNLECYLGEINTPTFFIRGTQDKQGGVFVADVGTINTTSGVFSIIEKNLPFYFNNKINSLSCRSIKKIPKGVKCVKIKRVTKTTYEEIGSIFGELENQFYLPHNVLKYNRQFTAEDQKINTENLCINLMITGLSKKFELKNNQIIYRNNNFSSPELTNILIKSSETLTNLILTESFPQKGSIPEFITSYINNENQYNSQADISYLNKTKKCFEDNCFNNDCFNVINNNSLINRSVDNRAIAWFIQYLSFFSISYNTDESLTITELTNYLLSQKDVNTNLFFKGWDQIELNQQTSDFNEDILYYSSSLTINKNLNASTNVSIFLALLKCFEITQDFSYLVEADNLYIAINKYLINSSGLLKHSINNSNTTLESATYQLLLNLVLEEYGSIEKIIEFFNIFIKAIPAQQEENVFVGSNPVTVNSINVTINPTNILNSDTDLNLFTPTSFDNINSIDDIFKYNYLISSSLIYLNKKIGVPFINLIKEKLDIIKIKVEESRENSSFNYIATCLIDNESFLGFDATKFNSLLEFNNYQFQKTLNFNKLLLNTPKDYGWFSSNKLNKSSNIGLIYYAIAQTLAKNSAEYETLQRNISIDSMYGAILNKKAKEYNIQRFLKESDANLRKRIKQELYTRGHNKTTIEEKLLKFDAIVNITDNHAAILTTEDQYNNYISNWGEGYLQGNNITTNIATFNFNQPVEEDIYKEIYKLKPLGTKIEIRENLTFFIGKNDTKIIITDSDPNLINYEYIATEFSDTITTENNNRIER